MFLQNCKAEGECPELFTRLTGLWQFAWEKLSSVLFGEPLTLHQHALAVVTTPQHPVREQRKNGEL